ncbi:Zinc finger protein 782 [Araneus ventricosus]|uniref:Zinc finger protein 782 n=1 Tax=Araneus ventricosus TaxID=182803 RepID=A0A4Y2KLG1_ARAVE|nr:Zinc finger protein 782 [Araneus ventricosus]
METSIEAKAANSVSDLHVETFGAVQIKTDMGMTPFKCDICYKIFSRKSRLTYHYRTHTKEKPYSCNVCNQKFSQKGNLNVHFRTHTHTKEKPYSCDACSKEFSQKSHLNRHYRTHTKEKPYSCVLCSKAFSQKCHLNEHYRFHTNEKPYSCDVCSKEFSLKDNLNKHYRIHTNEKPYSCDVCNKEFSLRDLIDAVYLNISQNFADINWLCERTILAPENVHVHEINNRILAMIPAAVAECRSFDIVVDADEAVNFPTEFLNSLDPAGLPPHRPTLKTGVLLYYYET